MTMMALIFRACMDRMASSTELLTSIETVSFPLVSSKSRTFIVFILSVKKKWGIH
jgi:hypothetical protein